MKAQRLSKSSLFRIKTQPSTVELLNQRNKYHRYDTSLYHKTNFHLKPLRDNPELYTKASTTDKTIAQVLGRSQATKSPDKYKKMERILLPQTISIRAELTKLAGLEKGIEKLLEEDTVMLVTAKKWVIYDMEANRTIKGFKHSKQHDIASITKVLTFYTAYMIIQRYYLSIDRLELLADLHDETIQGTRIKIKDEELMTLEDLLYAMMLESANNAATIIATNLGSLVRKKREGKYFSCFDISREDKEANMQVFLELMNSYARELDLKDSSFVNAHGMCRNKSTARDIAVLTSQCYKIPLFAKITSTKHHTGKVKYVSEEGEVQLREMPMTNTNRLLWLGSNCIGGKTGCNSQGGESLVACYEGSVIVVVLGCGGREDKFLDCEKLIGWLYKRLRCAS